MAATRFCSNVSQLRLLLAALTFCNLSIPSLAAVYDVGPGQAYTTIASFDWSALQPGDAVQIHYGIYHEFIGVTGQGTATQPIRVVGIPDPTTGALPVIDGNGATVGASLNLQFAAGPPERGLVSITPYNNAPTGYKPQYIEIANLQVQNAYDNNHFKYSNGETGAFLQDSAGIYIVAAEHIVITNCTITANSNGFVVASGDSSGGTEGDESRDITLQYSNVYGNGIPGQNGGHNIYSEASGIVYQYNHLGSPAAGSLGNNLKDRSAGTVIRYNWIESGSHMLDLVDPQKSANITVHEPSFPFTYVYGNVLHNTSTLDMVHYGGDHGVPANDRNGTIYFYNNTVVVQADQSALRQTELLELTDSGLSTQTAAQHGDVRNNILYVEAKTTGASQPLFDFGCDGPNAIYANWIGPSDGWQAGYNASTCLNVTGLSNLYVDWTNNPAFMDAAGENYTLLPESHAANQSVPLAPAVASNPMGMDYSVTRQYAAHQAGCARQVNRAVPDFGAFESAPAGPCSDVPHPISTMNLSTGADAATEPRADSGRPTGHSSSSDSKLPTGAVTGNRSGIGNLGYSAFNNSGRVSPAPACSSMSVGNNANLNGFVPFPPTNAWNTNIAAAPIDPNSAAIVAAAGFAGNHLHPDFGTESYYGIPYVVVDSTATPSVPINVIDYASESDVVVAPYPITAPIEGGPADCSGWPDTYNGDAHVLVLDRAKCVLYETFNTNRCNGLWDASSETIWDMSNNQSRPYGWTSADAAGLAIFPGLVRYDEVASGAIHHAIRFTLPHTKNDANGGYFVNPATHAAGTDWGVSNIMGMRIRLKASFDISGFSAVNQVILTAMQQYGLILADNGSYFYFQGASDPRWNDDDLAKLEQVGSANFDVVQMTPDFPGEDSGTAPTGPSPVIGSFKASASSVSPGAPVTFTYSASGDSYDYIDMIGPVTAGSGSVTINPTATQTYALNSTNAYGRTTTAPITVTVPGSVVAPPTFTPAAGAYGSAQTVTISTTTSPSATIHYTTNGSTPTTQSPIFSISSPISVSASETLKAIAVVTGYSTPSAVGSAPYTIGNPTAATPAFSPAAGTYASAQTVTISTTTPSAAIHYTTDGTTPTTSSTVYAGPITVSVSETVEAIATASGYSQSAVGSAAYIINLPTPPAVHIDSPAPGAAVSGTVTVSGWAIDNATAIGTAIGTVQVKVDGILVGTATYGISRPDVCSAYPGRPGCPNVGFTYSLNTATLTAGSHTLTVTATDTDSTPDTGTCSVTVTVGGSGVPAGPPSVHIDAPAAGTTVSGTVMVSGWAIDNVSAAGTVIGNVQIEVDGVTVGTATYGIGRPDVCSAYPGRPGCPNVGFTYSLNTATLTAGSHTLTVTATDTDSTPDTGTCSVTVTVGASSAVPPTVHIDAPATGTTVSGTVPVSGWAIDNASVVGTAISGVQVQVDGVTVGAATYGISRPDVCAAYPGRPSCPNVGFSYSLSTATLTTGSHTLTVTATDTDGTPDTGTSSVTITVGAATVVPPTVHIDAPATGTTVSGTVSVSGWAIDNASVVGTAIGGVQVQVDGVTVGTATYGISRPDVCSAYPGRPSCPNVGFAYSLNTATLASGSHALTVTATDTDNTPDTGSATITVLK